MSAWADIAQDHNPLHLDPEFAANTSFGIPIVHGHLLACLVADTIQWDNGTAMAFAVRFKAPVPVGSDVLIRIDRDHDSAVTVSVDGSETISVDIASG